MKKRNTFKQKNKKQPKIQLCKQIRKKKHNYKGKVKYEERHQ